MKRRDFLQGISATVALAALPVAAVAAVAAGGGEEGYAVLAYVVEGGREIQTWRWLSARMKRDAEGATLSLAKEHRFEPGRAVKVIGVDWLFPLDKPKCIYTRRFDRLHLAPGDTLVLR